MGTNNQVTELKKEILLALDNNIKYNKKVQTQISKNEDLIFFTGLLLFVCGVILGLILAQL